MPVAARASRAGNIRTVVAHKRMNAKVAGAAVADRRDDLAMTRKHPVAVALEIGIAMDSVGDVILGQLWTSYFNLVRPPSPLFYFGIAI